MDASSGETEGATGRGEDERFLIDRGFTASATFFMKFAMTFAPEINARRERVYELLTYSILLFSPTGPEIGMNRRRSKSPVGSAVNGAILAYDFPSPDREHGAGDKNLYGECVDASLYSVKHCTTRSTILYIRTAMSYTRERIFSGNLLRYSAENFLASFFMPFRRTLFEFRNTPFDRVL